MSRRLMQISLVLFALSARGAIAQAPPASGFAVKGCDEPKVPIGVLPKAGGTVSFKLSKDGKPDVESLAITKLLGMSAAGFKSAVSRHLSGCHFDVPKAGGSGPLTVSAEVTTDSFRIRIGPATPGDPGTALALESFAAPHDTMPYPSDDRRVEERPRQLACTRQTKAPTVIHASGTSAAAAQADAQQQARVMNEQYRAANGGTLTAVVRVSTDGKPGSQIRVISITNAPALQNLGDYMGSCRFAPGRILGVAVPTLFETSVGDGSI